MRSPRQQRYRCIARKANTMSLPLLKSSSECDEQTELNKLKIISKFWSLKQWSLYLKCLELTPNEEEIYVGTSIDLEKYVARKSRNGFIKAHTGDE